MKIQFISHASFESPGAFFEYAAKNNHQTSICNINIESLPSINEFDVLIIMGGPQSPLELDKYPYLAKEILLINEAVENNKKVIGVCLGAQLLALALGGGVAKSPQKEMGWFPIQLTDEAIADPNLIGFPKEFEVMHWHYDMPVLSDDLKLLASSEGCPVQIFGYKGLAYGFQCHLEFTKNTTAKLINNSPNDLEPSIYTQTSDEIIAGNFQSLNYTLYTFLDQFLKT